MKGVNQILNQIVWSKAEEISLTKQERPWGTFEANSNIPHWLQQGMVDVVFSETQEDYGSLGGSSVCTFLSNLFTSHV